MWRPKLVALDIDGTLVDGDDRVPPELRAAISDAVASGARVVLCTGRGWHATRHHAEALGLPHGPHVCSNGAVIVDFPPFHLDEVITFDPRSVIEQVAAQHPRCLIAVEIVGQGYKVNRHFPQGELGGRIDIVSIEQLCDQPATRVVVRDPDASDGEFVTMAERLGLTGVSYSIGYTAWLDIAPEGVDKGHGLLRVCDRLGIKAADVLAMGDGRNDIEMITVAGRGVALGDGADELKAVADAVTGNFAAGGTASELRRWFPVQRAGVLKPRG